MATSNQTIGPRQGKVGEFCVYEMGGKQVWRSMPRRPKGKRRTAKTLGQRTKMGNIVSAWKAFDGGLKGNFELRTGGQTDYNAFVSVNLTNARVFLTREEADAHRCAIDNFVVSQGTLKPSVEVRHEGDYFLSDIQLGNLLITPETTVAALSNALVKANNGRYLMGDELLLHFNKMPYPYPEQPKMERVYFETLRITLSPSDLSALPNFGYLPVWLSVEGRLAFPWHEGRFVAWVHRRRDAKGHLCVTTQSLVGDNPLLARYATDAARQRAIGSYGDLRHDYLDPAVKLPPVPDAVLPETNDSELVSIQTSVLGEGSVSGAGNYRRDTVFTLAATPAPGHRFKCWLDGDLSPQRRLLALQSASYTAIFEPQQ